MHKVSCPKNLTVEKRLPLPSAFKNIWWIEKPNLIGLKIPFKSKNDLFSEGSCYRGLLSFLFYQRMTKENISADQA